MVINEQGLDDASGGLRIVKAHANFRPIFILTKKSLVEQGKDVSRAMWNRCVELSVEYKMDDEKLDMTIADQEVDGRNVEWSLNYLQTKHDLLPCQSIFKKPSEGNEQHSDDEMKGTVLGKRTRELKTIDEDVMKKVESNSDQNESKAYPFIFLEHALIFPGSASAVEQIQKALNVQR